MSKPTRRSPRRLEKDDTSLFAALGDPTRRAIIRMLRGGSMGAGALAAAFELSKPTLSHHFAVLRAAGLLRAERQGTHIVYTLQTNAVEDFTAAVLELFGTPENARKETTS